MKSSHFLFIVIYRLKNINQFIYYFKNMVQVIYVMLMFIFLYNLLYEVIFKSILISFEPFINNAL